MLLPSYNDMTMAVTQDNEIYAIFSKHASRALHLRIYRPVNVKHGGYCCTFI